MIYQLDTLIEMALHDAYDPETGELMEGVTEEGLFAEIERITKDHDVTIDSIASEIKNLAAEAQSVKEEKLKLAERQSKIEARLERTKRLLAWLLHGEKWKNGRHNITYRRSTALVLDDEFMSWAKDNAPDLLNYKEPEPRKQDITNALKAGFIIDHAHLEQKNNIQVK